MDINLIKGSYEHGDAVELVKRLVECKIRFLEESIGRDMAEEDMKMRERRIVELQNQMHQLKSTSAESVAARMSISADIHLN